jgi:hypothetical protein
MTGARGRWQPGGLGGPESFRHAAFPSARRPEWGRDDRARCGFDAREKWTTYARQE